MKQFRTMIAMVLLLTVVTPSTPLYAGSEGTELPFVAGTSGRASGMGLATTSLFGAPSVQYFNPALIAYNDRQEIELYRTTLYDSDSKYNTFSYVYPTLDWGSIGVTILRLDVSSIEERDDTNNLLSTDLKNSVTRVLLGYAVNVHNSLSVGANFKIDRQTFGDFSGTGIGLDAGLLFNHEVDGPEWLGPMRAALTLENLMEPSVKLDQENVADPMRLIFGLSADAHYLQFGSTTAFDVVSPRESPARVRIGQEITYTEYFALRFGVDGSTPTFGLGGAYGDISIDYAYRSENLGSNHRISVATAFGATRQDRAQVRRVRRDAEMQRRVSRTVNDLENRQVARLTQHADSLFAAGQFDAALGQYEMLLLWNPQNSHAVERTRLTSRNIRVKAAEKLVGEDQYLDALYQLKQALQFAPDDPAIEELIALAEKRIAEAEDHTQMTRRLLAKSIDLYARGKYVDARTGFDEVLRLDPTNQIAREYRDKSLTNTRTDVRQRRDRARLLADRGDISGAIQEIRAALALKPYDESLKEELARLTKQAESAEAARKAASAASRSLQETGNRSVLGQQELDNRFEHGVALLEDGRFDEAARQLMRVWAASPTHRNVAEPLTRAYLFMGMKLYSNGDYRDAIRLWEKILTIDATNMKARRYLDKSREEAARLSRFE